MSNYLHIVHHIYYHIYYYLIISHWRRREYRRVVTETKSRWLSRYSQSLRWLIVLVKLHWWLFEKIKQKQKFATPKHPQIWPPFWKPKSVIAIITQRWFIAGENEVLDQPACAIFDNQQCSFTNNDYLLSFIIISSIISQLSTFILHFLHSIHHHSPSLSAREIYRSYHLQRTPICTVKQAKSLQIFKRNIGHCNVW